MPTGPQFTNDGPTPSGKTVRAAKGPITPADAEDVVASLEPDDDLDELVALATDAPLPAKSPLPEKEKTADGTEILIHVREDGFTANGRVWYRGQELLFVVGDEAYKDTQDRHGRSWLSLTDNDQMRIYGQVMFGFGPWPGATYDNTKALEAERMRDRTPPTIGKISSSSRL